MSLFRRNKKTLLFIFYLICIIPAIFSLSRPGFFVSDDGTWMIIRFSAFYEALRSGQFPVRYVLQLNNGFGYPVINFLYPLYLYFAVPFHILKFSFVDSIKIIFGLSIIFSGIFSLFWFKKKFSNLSSFIGSLVYVYFPYHLWDVYKRGSIGEVLALAIIPFIFWQIENENIILTGLGIGLLILSHNILALLFLPVIIIYMILSSRFNFKEIIASVMVGFGSSIFFWLPALYEKQFTVFNSIKISQAGRYFINNQLDLVGIIGLISLACGMALIFRKLRKENIFFSIVVLISAFFASSLSNQFWNLNLFVTYIQFPFRFLSLAILGSAFLAAAYADQFSKNNQKIFISAVLIIVLIFSSWKFLVPQTFVNYPNGYYSTNRGTTTVGNEYMPSWVKEIPSSSISQSISSNTKDTVITNKKIIDKSISFDVMAYNPSQITVGIIDYPGWTGFVNGKNVKISHNNKYGLIQVKIPEGKHLVKVIFNETPLRIISDIISLLTFFACGILYIVMKGKHESN